MLISNILNVLCVFIELIVETLQGLLFNCKLFVLLLGSIFIFVLLFYAFLFLLYVLHFLLFFTFLSFFIFLIYLKLKRNFFILLCFSLIWLPMCIPKTVFNCIYLGCVYNKTRIWVHIMINKLFHY